MKKFINGKMINLAEPRLGSKVIFKTDDFFASANRIINPNPPIFKKGVFDKHGKWMDGWETRRRRKKGFDYVIVKLGRNKIEKLIKNIGLFRNNAKSDYLLSKQLIEKHNGKVPKNFYDLYALPGVGKKTASVVLNEGFGLPTIAVDTHVFRVSNRTGLAYGKNPDEVQKNLYKVVPKKYLKKAGHSILLHGRYTCKARKPLCKICVIRKYCKFKNKELNW